MCWVHLFRKFDEIGLWEGLFHRWLLHRKIVRCFLRIGICFSMISKTEMRFLEQHSPLFTWRDWSASIKCLKSTSKYLLFLWIICLSYECIFAYFMVLAFNTVFIGISFIRIYTCGQRFLIMHHSMSRFQFIDRSMSHWLLGWQDKIMHISHFTLVILQLGNIYSWSLLVHALCSIGKQTRLFCNNIFVKLFAKKVISWLYVLVVKFSLKISRKSSCTGIYVFECKLCLCLFLTKINVGF